MDFYPCVALRRAHVVHLRRILNRALDSSPGCSHVTHRKGEFCSNLSSSSCALKRGSDLGKYRVGAFSPDDLYLLEVYRVPCLWWIGKGRRARKGSNLMAYIYLYLLRFLSTASSLSTGVCLVQPRQTELVNHNQYNIIILLDRPLIICRGLPTLWQQLPIHC